MYWILLHIGILLITLILSRRQICLCRGNITLCCVNLALRVRNIRFGLIDLDHKINEIRINTADLRLDLLLFHSQIIQSFLGVAQLFCACDCCAFKSLSSSAKAGVTIETVSTAANRILSNFFFIN